MIISNNALKLFDTLPSDLIIRINVAWCKSIEELKTIIDNSTHPIYLDYPSGRTKPPKPEIFMEDVVDLLNSSYRVKYFAFSNAENPEEIVKLRRMIFPRVKLVPKIETIIGVEKIVQICDAAETDMIMLDHEDLYVNVKHDSVQYNFYMDIVSRKCKENNIKLYKVQGIIFDEHKEK